MDDCVTGADSPPDAVDLQSQLQEILSKGNFLLPLPHSLVLDSLPADLRDPGDQVHLDSDLAFEALGIIWNTSSDLLSHSPGPTHQTCPGIQCLSDI